MKESGLMNRAYSDFSIREYPQNDASRIASITANRYFDYDELSMNYFDFIYFFIISKCFRCNTSLEFIYFSF
jgi:hypothetical protein